MPSSEKERLLQDILHEGDYPAFREELFHRTRREFRRRHRRSVLPWLALAASALLGLFLWHSSASRRAASPAVEAAAAPTPLESAPVASPRPLAQEPALAIVRSSTLPEASRIRTTADATLLVATRSHALPGTLLVTTRPEPPPLITDQELLALFPDQGVGFIHTPAGERRFILLAAHHPLPPREPSP